MIKRVIITLALMFCVVVMLFLFSRCESTQLMGVLVDRVETSQKVVALTFDDGPQPGYTQEILSVLAAENVTATFYFIGKNIERHEDETLLVVDAGHELGNHSYSHPRMVLKSQSFIEQEILTTDALIKSVGQSGEIYFRPPFGKKLFALPYYLHKTNRTSITWDVAPERALGQNATAAELSDYVLENTRPGSIILMHVMYPSRKNSMQSVQGIIRGLKLQGYEFLTVSELLSLNQGTND